MTSVAVWIPAFAFSFFAAEEKKEEKILFRSSYETVYNRIIFFTFGVIFSTSLGKEKNESSFIYFLTFHNDNIILQWFPSTFRVPYEILVISTYHKTFFSTAPNRLYQAEKGYFFVSKGNMEGDRATRRKGYNNRC